MKLPRGGIHGRELGWLLALAGVVVLLWDTPLVFPLKVLVVFFHELSHGLAALATGGSIEGIYLSAEEGGRCVTVGGSPFLILSAGYLGSLSWGGVILILASRVRFDRALAGVLGGLLVLLSLLWVRPIASFGFAFGVLAGAALAAAARWLTPAANELFLKLIGLTSCLYAVLDIKSDILDRPSGPSDAAMLAERTGIPALVWGLAWVVVATAGALGFLLLASRREGAPSRSPGR